MIHRKYIGLRLECGGWPHSRVAVAVGRQPLRRGFSLVEMLVVIAIIVILMGASNVLIRTPMSSAGEPASRMVRCIEMARAKAVASNRNVALRFDPQTSDNREMVIRFLWARPGQTAFTLKEMEFRRAERFPNIVISKDVVIPDGMDGSGGTGGVLPARHLEPGESLVMTPDGQILLGTGSSGFPVSSDQLEPIINLGVQPTIAGRVLTSARRDVAIVQIQCASGTARVIQP
jgi:prepilin-type N-terminal cleavage/methylation domain-containing protein